MEHPGGHFATALRGTGLTVSEDPSKGHLSCSFQRNLKPLPFHAQLRPALQQRPRTGHRANVRDQVEETTSDAPGPSASKPSKPAKTERS